MQKSCRRGLVFCSRNDEASYFAQAFCERGLPSRAISGASSIEERDRAIRELEQGSIDYIFSVDIVNEGVDIPSLNQIVMLRRTESAIVFVQQLGRGLRKCDGKEFYFLGQMHPTGEFEATTMEDGKTNVVEIAYALEQPVRADLYDYLISNLDG
nr:DUF3427 domain-containing protein [uncultured Ellagibacter sp.]